MQLAHPLWLLLMLLWLLPWLFMRHKGYIGYSDSRLLHKQSIGSWLLHKLPILLYSIAYAFLLICLARPQIPHSKTTREILTRDIVIAVDISGSMENVFKGEIPKRKAKIPGLDKDLPAQFTKVNHAGRQENVGKAKIDGARAAVLRFVENCFVLKTGDRIAILAFDTSPHWLWPLTDDLKLIWRNGLFIDQGLGGGTNFGENIPGPIDAAAEQFDEMGKSTTRVMIMVTDGMDNLSSLTLYRLKQLITSRNIHFYVIGVGEEVSKANLQIVDIFRLTEMVGGKIFRVENPKDLPACFHTINGMEQSRVEIESKIINYEQLFHYPLIAFFAFTCLGLMADVVIVKL